MRQSIPKLTQRYALQARYFSFSHSGSASSSDHPAKPGEQKAHQVLVIGGGAGGLAIASSMLFQGYNVGIVEPADTHYYQPMWTLVGGGLKRVENSKKPMSSVIPVGATWYKSKCEGFIPDENSVVTSDNTKIKYDALVVAVGIDIKWDKIKGLKEAMNSYGRVSSNYSYRHAPLTWELIRTTTNGIALFTFPASPVKCAGAPQKIMYLAESYWRKQGIRHNIEIVFNSGLGKLFSSDHYGNALNKICDEKYIERNYGLDLVEVNGQTHEAVFAPVKGIRKEGEPKVLKYDMMHVAPPQGAYDFVKQSPIADPVGWVEVDSKTLQHKRFPNIFSLGDCSSLPTSKTAAAVAEQSRTLKENLACFLSKKPLTAEYDGYTSCPIPVGDGKLILAEFDYTLKPKETFWFDQSVPSSFAYFLKSEVMPGMYWDGLLKGTWEGPSKIRKLFHP